MFGQINEHVWCLLGHSHQPLQGSLLVDLIGAVCDVRVKVGLSVLVDNVADVIDHYVLLVSFLQFLKEPEPRMEKKVSVSGTRFIPYMATCTSQVIPHTRGNIGYNDR